NGNRQNSKGDRNVHSLFSSLSEWSRGGPPEGSRQRCDTRTVYSAAVAGGKWLKAFLREGSLSWWSRSGDSPGRPSGQDRLTEAHEVRANRDNPSPQPPPRNGEGEKGL